LIRAAPGVLAEFPAARFLVVGGVHAAPPGYMESLLQLAAQLGVERRVTFTGFRDDVAEFLAAFDMLVLTSQRESFGKVLIEAMASGKPVINAAQGGPAEIIQHGVTGLLIPPCSPESVAGAILELARDPQRAQAMGRAGRAWVKGRFSVDKYAADIQDVFAEVLAGRARPARRQGAA
jgi:glycosyltransferase involved in cell wall biosynthesis